MVGRTRRGFIKQVSDFKSIDKSKKRKISEISDKNDEMEECTETCEVQINNINNKLRRLNMTSEEKFDKLLSHIEEISQRLAFGPVIQSPRKIQSQRKTKNKRHNDDNTDDEIPDDSEKSFTFTQSPPFIKGVMRDYQIRGLNWFISLRDANINGILADEMGLGKTLQTISILAYVKFFEEKIKNVDNKLPSLIIAPLSTLHSWANEFNKWTNKSMKTVVIHGDSERRKEILTNELIYGEFDVAITTYEMFNIFTSKLRKFNWEYVVIDEAHRIKNEASLLARGVRTIKSKHKVLLTGTPLQNNLHELWALLNFLQPDIFENADEFDDWFDSDKCLANETLVVKRIQKVIQPFMLRRIKKDVEKNLLPKKETTLFVGLTKIQKDLYKSILKKDVEFVVNGKITRKRLLGLMVQLRKVTSHPYLFPGIEPGPPYEDGDHIVKCCGKLNVLDKLLIKLKCQGSRVLVFTQFVGTLDILEDYMTWKNLSYHRLDGGTAHSERQEAIEEFQSPKSKTFAFLISTRAGGLGITLTAADVVIFYDIDWNPQMDLQAADRAHRIGQKKEVKVFRIISEGTVDERIYETAEKKLRLDNLVIQKGRMNEMKKEMNKDDIMEIICKGIGENVSDTKDDENVEYDIEKILENSSKKFEEVKARLNAFSSAEPQDNLVFDTVGYKDNKFSLYNFEGNDYKALLQLNMEKMDEETSVGLRQRRQRFVIEQQVKDEEKDIEKLNQKKMASLIRHPPFPKDFVQCKDYFLCDNLYKELSDRYLAYYRKSVDFSYIPKGTINISDDIKEKQAIIDNAEPLTESEMQQMNDLKKKAFFSNWSTKDFTKIKGFMSSLGTDYEKIHESMPEYDIDEIKRYGDRLLEYAKENNMSVFLSNVEKANISVAKKKHFIKIINALYKNANGDPQGLDISNKHYTKRLRSSNFSLEVDKYIFYHFISKILEKNISFENLTRDKITPLISWRTLFDIKRSVKTTVCSHLTTEIVVSRFLDIFRFLLNGVNLDASLKLPRNDSKSNHSLEKQKNQLNRFLFKPLKDRCYILQKDIINETSSSSKNINVEKVSIKGNPSMLKSKALKRNYPFLSNDGGDLKKSDLLTISTKKSQEKRKKHRDIILDSENKTPPKIL
uniref:ISWI chromatin-remodeling complex ATPase ISW1 n=1 Tax=Parastrongyloides trichosuri TaxID=131310 RepID=A0A0N4ZT85_PARTI